MVLSAYPIKTPGPLRQPVRRLPTSSVYGHVFLLWKGSLSPSTAWHNRH